ncbi:hypothetical protein COCC4DRAFT_172220 [Bipolaris maydis ATCC 48331]|uniref:Oxidoreductase n=2 Tax=Cochliobolus heterostrophus TaxID=5016 RepID=M2UDY1_COCH5|nr:uncharacterized protein COCC4DRAFT_172220 [Bipolaris maydis ATCC 48331]EMD96764.1 hypothetical protein COCHEDRAFT_1199627 [Bipolaris maydis C5]KAH7558267.1 hypothetical protein BM1_05539 [Bipolaris maydis]ENI03631.1 hypothetical protein COCC4DRAFT_172220 [Bipolaris maydis ATCC 48331]KAJ5031353.1 hypothetical protein J3E73DRAFT_223359 [Bipolaris maydis]KAJ5060597.1 hypothetical protein J3E74DRAFT_271682 [Bipolaris maydis]
MGSQLSLYFPPPPVFTEKSLPDLSSKTYIVTGASAGVGKELARLLYSRNGNVYLATRSTEKTNAAMSWIKERHPDSKGNLHFLKLDLNDLGSIKPAAEEFLTKEKRLDVLFNNAGVMTPPQGSQTKQGYELQLGTNCLGPFLFTKLLTPLLAETAKSSPAGDVRVVWASSIVANMFAPPGGVDMQNLDYKKDKSAQHKYAVSKGGNSLYAIEYQRRFRDEGIVSSSFNPGNLKSELQRNTGFFMGLIMKPILHEPVYGAYTELFAGLSPDGAKLKEGQWIAPWGRIVDLRKDYVTDGKAGEFWKWSEEQVKSYV